MGYIISIFPPEALYAVLGLLSLAMIALAPVLPGRTLWWIHVVAILVCNTATLVLALRKAKRPSPERDGWRAFAAGIAVAFLGNLFWLILPSGYHQAMLGQAVVYGTMPVSGALLFLAVWLWPWRGREGNGASYALGSLVFCLSFLLFPWIKGVWSPILQGQPPCGSCWSL